MKAILRIAFNERRVEARRPDVRVARQGASAIGDEIEGHPDVDARAADAMGGGRAERQASAPIAKLEGSLRGDQLPSVRVPVGADGCGDEA